jgi:hypothetical protein
MSKLQARNELVINAPVGSIYNLITDIKQLPTINPGVITATGRMDKQGETRTCEINNRGKIGTMTEKLIELIPEKRTVWAIENDDMGMSKMLKETKFYFHLEKISDNKTRVINETYYRPANLMARIMNGLMMKKMISKAQAQILSNLKSLSEK